MHPELGTSTATMRRQFVLVLALALALAVVQLVDTTPRTARAQTKSPTRKPSTPATTPSRPQCAIYGQLPQILNATGVEKGLAGLFVGLSGDASLMAVGSPGDGWGSISIYTRSGALYTRVTTLRPPAWTNAKFISIRGAAPFSFSKTGDTIAVGAIQVDNEFNGSVLVFRATTRGFLTFNASLIIEESLSAGTGNDFASAVSVSPQGDFIGVVAPLSWAAQSYQGGGVAVYRRGGPGAKPWEFALEAFVHPSQTEDSMQVGSSVAITDGGVLVVGASLYFVGGIFTFAKSIDGTWAQQGPIILGDAANYAAQRFGFAVALDKAGLTLVVSDPQDGTEAMSGGAVFFSSRASRGTLWGPFQRVAPSVRVDSANFGFALTMNDAGTTAIVGAPYIGYDASGGPAVYRIDRSASTGLWAINGTGYILSLIHI